MIKSVEINNFRCFNESKFSGFQAINLIGGKNNSGKTAFLESVFLNTAPKTSSIELLRRFRGIDSAFMKEMPERAWNNLFKDFDRKEATITVQKQDSNKLKLTLSSDESVDDFIHLISDENEKLSNNKNFSEIKELLSNKQSTKSTLHLRYAVNDRDDTVSTLVAYNNGILGKDMNIPNFSDIFFFPSSLKLSSQALAEEFDKADLNGFGDRLLSAFQIIDPQIIEVKTMSIGSPSIYLRAKSGELLPIGLFGDAINKVSFFILKIINSKDSIILIDEIENGIHYSIQRSLWDKIFQLALEFNVQIFATTHSIEMIKAFTDILEQYKGKGQYFEFYKHHKTGEINANLHTFETLSFELQNKMPIRGE